MNKGAKEIKVDYFAEPTPAKFHASAALVKSLMGPIGSGKTVACVIEILSKSKSQGKGPDGVRRTRWAIIRNTYSELHTTTIKTFQEWIPPEICPLKGVAPIFGRMKQALPDGSKIDMEVIFVSVDRPEDIKKLLSMELTGAFINELREISKTTLDQLVGRVGRYPPKRLGGPTWSGVIMDTNPPDDDHWFYKIAEEEKPEGYECFRQPPAIIQKDGKWIANPKAENVGNQPLGSNYWLRQVASKTPDWIKVYLKGEYGTVEEGKRVYPEFSESVHISAVTIKPVKNEPLIVSFDFGLTPAAIIQQVVNGQFRALRELVAENMGVRNFARNVVKPYLGVHFNGYEVAYPGDPAGVARMPTDEKTVFTILEEEGITAHPAASNNFIARREAVVGFLSKMVEGKPGYQIDPSCKMLIKGFKGAYKYRRLQVVGEDRYTEKPDKNRFSHPHDAHQYGAMYAIGYKPVKASKIAPTPPSGGDWMGR